MPDKVAPETTQLSDVVKSKTQGKKQTLTTDSTKTTTPQWKKDMRKYMDGAPMQIFLGVLLIISLFLPDAWVLGDAPDASNIALDIILIIIFVVFAVESIILSIVNPDYFMSFFFWCDIVGTISILLDIGMFTDLYSSGNNSSRQSGALLRAARAAKVGARYGRLMRLLKLMKFMDYLPCFSKNDEEVSEPSLSAARKVSNKLSGVLSRRVAGLVLLLVIVVPLLTYDMYFGVSSYNPSFGAFAKAIETLGHGSACNTNDALIRAVVENFYDFHQDKHRDKTLVDVSVVCTNSGDAYTYTQIFANEDNIRANNLETFEKYGDGVTVSGQLDVTLVARFSAMFNILLIILVIVVLLGFSASFQNAVDVLVVVPLEKMMGTLRESATAILRSVSAMEEGKEGENDENVFADDDNIDDAELETALLEKMIEKLARVTAHLLPQTTEIVAANDNVDTATASWLNSNYSTSSGTRATMIAKQLPLQIDSSLQTLKSGIDVSKVNSWSFDVLNYQQQELFEVNQYIFSQFGIFNDFSLPIPVFEAFMLEMSKQYKKENTYHNFFHACDVCHTVYRLIMLSELHKILSPLEIFSLIVAAISHDVGHPGVNNAFLVKSKDKLAFMHNDRSPLENMHCSTLYQIMQDPNKNVMCGLTDSQWRESRKLITSAILGTDMIHHFKQISSVQIFLEVNGQEVKDFLSGKTEEVTCLNKNDERIFIAELFLHAADIANPYKPFDICKKWAMVVVEEFFSQGDQEKAAGFDVSPMFDRESTNLYNMQMGFIEFVVAPLVNGFISIFPPLYEAGDYMKDNMLSWGEWRKKEILADEKIINKDDEIKKLDDRLAKFSDKMSFVSELKEFETARMTMK